MTRLLCLGNNSASLVERNVPRLVWE